LREGVQQSQFNGWLVAELEDHFGLDADARREAALAAELVRGTACMVGAKFNLRPLAGGRM
jgi:hypothetical protein